MEETRPKAFVFVLMPFSDTFDDIYEVGIKEACTNAGAYCERVDQQIFEGNILERVYNQIDKADLVVAELTGGNPNVYYETGYAHALNKRVVLLTQNAEDIPFDLRQFPHIVYGGKIAALKKGLEERVRWCIENPVGSLRSVDTGLQFFINGQALSETAAPQIDVNVYGRSGGTGVGSFWKDEILKKALNKPQLSISMSVHNSGVKALKAGDFSLALASPASFVPLPGPSVRNVARMPNGSYIYNLRLLDTDVLFAGSWASLEFDALCDAREGLPRAVWGLTLQVFTELGTKNYPVKLKVVRIVPPPPVL